MDPNADLLDGNVLKKNFSGKTRAEALHMFEQRAAANLAGDYLFMSHQALDYYLPAALVYLESPSSRGDGDFLDWITTSLSIRRKYDEFLPAETLQLIRDIASYVKGHRQKFGCCEDPAHVRDGYDDRLKEMARS